MTWYSADSGENADKSKKCSIFWDSDDAPSHSDSDKYVDWLKQKSLGKLQLSPIGERRILFEASSIITIIKML